MIDVDFYKVEVGSLGYEIKHKNGLSVALVYGEELANKIVNFLNWTHYE